jgi:hypothetical protein
MINGSHQIRIGSKKQIKQQIGHDKYLIVTFFIFNDE